MLRLAGASIFLFNAAAAPWRMAESTAFLMQVISLVLGVLLLAGVWTPVVAALAAVAALLKGCFDPVSSYWLLGAICAALALLGPGAWSVDARLFGWKRIDIDT